MTEKMVQVKKAGAFIAPFLESDGEGKIIGVTSKGVFLLFDERIVFLTHDDHDNPFMLYIGDEQQYLHELALNAPVQLSNRHLLTGNMDFDLSSVVHVVPQPLPQVKAQLLKRRVSSQMVSIFQVLNIRAHDDSFIFIADALLNRNIPVDPARQDVWFAIRKLQKGAREGDLGVCEEALMQILGSGKGLTPSGDDFVTGYLLILNCLADRAGKVDEFTLRLNSKALELARKRTTWISANLIEAAALRLVDERVGLAAMVLMNSCKLDPVTVARKLESFGNSSGIDAFAGMVAALVNG